MQRGNNIMKNRISSFILAVISFALVISTYSILNYQQSKSMEQTNRLIALKELTTISDKIQMSLNLDLQFASFYSVLISNDPDISDDYLIEISKHILDQHGSIKNIALAPDGVLSFFYPKEGNEHAIGHNLLEDKERESFVRQAIETKSSTTQGPVEAIQGGTLIFNREAIFIERDGREEFWGLTAVSVDFDELIEENGLKSSDNGYLFALKADKANGVDDFLWGNEQIFKKNSIINTIDLPNQQWHIAIYPEKGWGVRESFFTPISILFYILSIMVFIATYMLSMYYKQRIHATKLDFLTGTYSKEAFLAYVNKNIMNVKKKHAIIILDLNKFKKINDTLGHPVGDKVLIEVSDRLESLLKKRDILSRVAGDEYMIYIDKIEDEKDIDNITASISSTISKPMYIEGNEIKIGVAIGTAIFPTDATSFEKLYEISDRRMYENKGS